MHARVPSRPWRAAVAVLAVPAAVLLAPLASASEEVSATQGELTPVRVSPAVTELPSAVPEPSLAPPTSPSPNPTPTVRPLAPLSVVDDAVTTSGGQAVHIDYGVNDAVPEGAPAVSTLTSPPGQGIAELTDGLLVYTPATGYAGTDTMAYTTCIGEDGSTCATATVTVTVSEQRSTTPAPSQAPQGPAPRSDTGAALPDACRGVHAWGGWQNGRIPREMLASIGGGHVLEANAAGALLALREAAAAEGVAIGVTDSYRSYEAQVSVRARKGGQVATATPGTSIHGWGRALDLDVGSATVRGWLEANAPRFGWVNPAWARRAGKSFEPWHYEFFGPATEGPGGTCAVLASAGPAPATPGTETGVGLGTPEPTLLHPLSFVGPDRDRRIAVVAALLIAWQAAAAALLWRLALRRRSS